MGIFKRSNRDEFDEPEEQFEELEFETVEDFAPPSGLSSLIGFTKGPLTWKKLAAPVLTLALILAVLGVTGTLTPGGDGDGLGSDAQRTQYIEDQASVIATNQWVNFYGLESTIDGAPLPAGTVVTAYDPQGVPCGEFTVTTGGRYGLMPVYADDPTTDVDEGAQPGDTIALRVDGFLCSPSGPDAPVWGEMGELIHVELTASTTP